MEDRRENKSTSKKSKKDDVKKKKQEKSNTRTNSNTPDENKIYSEIKNNIRSYGIIILLVLMVLLSIYLQYRHERALRLSKVSDDEVQENYYEVLGVNQNADLATIRKQYKELTKIWHPDKNPGCKPCHDKFLLISKAYEVLSDDVKKGELDSKGKSIFSSQPVQLTVKNYHHLVEESNDFWVILIYENTRGNNYNKFVAEVWDEVSSKNNNIVKFGVIDVLQNENILHFLPYKFQFYPNIITYLHGEGSELFQNIESFSVKSKIIF
jgi:preprotein translocase subunit Sec63